MKNYNEQNKNEVAQRRNDSYLFDPFFGDFFDFPAFSHHEFRDLEKAMKTDIKENENGYELEVELPGYNKEDINMNIKNGYLNISASKSENNDEKDKKGNFIRRERRYGSCSRSFYVGDVKEEDVDAKLEHGVLTINIPKENKKVEQTKRILIK